MKSKVLVVSAAETFTVKGIEMKLQGIGTNPVYCEMTVDALSRKIESTEMVLLCADEEVGDAMDAVVYIKDWCQEHDRQVFVVGSKNDNDTVFKMLSAEMIFGLYERPIQMDRFLDDVEKYLATVANQAKRKSILIVDDDVAYMTMIMDWLKDSYRVSMATSGLKAITWLSKNTPDLILLDYEMPVVTGPQVMEMFQTDPEISDIPVMFLTGNSDKESILKVISLGPVDYLLKTIDKKGLREKLDIYFETHS